MDALTKLRSNFALSTLTALALGVALHYAYSIARLLFQPLAVWIGPYFIDPYAEYSWVSGVTLNVVYSAVSGLAASVVILTAMVWLLRPKTHFLPQVAALPFIVLSYWWFVRDVPGFLQAASTEHIFTVLASHLGAIGVWLLTSWWVIRRQTANKRSQRSPLRGPAAG